MSSSTPRNREKHFAFADGPLAEYAQQFKGHMEAQHYSKATIYQYHCSIDAFFKILKDSKIEIRSIDEGQVGNLIAASNRPRLGKYDVFIVQAFIRFLSGMGVTKPLPPQPLDESPQGVLRREYEEYLRNQRGLSKSTVKQSWWLISHFLTCCFGKTECDLSQITAADIVKFLQQKVSRPGPLRDRTSPSHLKNFLLFLFKSNRTVKNLALNVLTVAHNFGTRLPRHLTAEQVEVVLAALREDTHLGRRNYAMMLLLARLGLRSEEVIAIQIDDIDWRAGEILIRGKGKRHDRMPFPKDVGEAVAEYIRCDRQTSTRSLFVTDRAPRVAITYGTFLNTILKKALAKTGLTPTLPWVGTHLLRHSLAVSLTQKGASLEEIADMLRHRSRSTTMMYARLDVEGMRSIVSFR
jgi:site-specific recombinase XerD